MKRPTIFFTAVALLLLTSVALAGAISDQPRAIQSYEVFWWTADGGGGTSSGGDYGLSGTIGQTDAGAASEGDYALTSGFWAWQGEYTIFMPLVLRNY